MRLWVSGPRMGPFRPSISFGPEDWGRRSSTGVASRSASGFVYVIVRDGDHRLKIGSSVNPPQRLAGLQTGSADLLSIAWSIPIQGDYVAVEREAHAILDRHRGLGEWFSVPVDVAVAAISAAAYRLQNDAPPSLQTSSVSSYAAALIGSAGFWVGVTANMPSLSVFSVILGCSALAIISARRGPMFRSRHLWKLIAALFAGLPVGLMICAAARAETAIPAYDSGRYCRNLAALMGDNALIKTGCETSEESVHQKIVRVWPETPDGLKANCVATVAAGSSGNYQSLGGCLSLSIGSLWLDGDLAVSKRPR